MKQQLAMIIDSSKCIDCKACMVACKVENEVPQGFSRNWIKVQEPDYSQPDWMSNPVATHFQPGGCMHCDEPICVNACPTGATYKDGQDGAIKVNEELCIGCSSCVAACPYGARFRHPIKKVVDKCDYCEPRRSAGKLPACVDTCPTKARVFGDIHDAAGEAGLLFKSQKLAKLINVHSDTQPNMYYIDNTAPVDWPRQAGSPAPIRIFEAAAKPVVWASVGINALLVLGMLGQQFIGRKNKVAAQPSNSAEEYHE